MTDTGYVIVIVITVVLLVALIIARRYSETPHQTNFKALFVLGLAWIVVGISSDNLPLLVLGILFMVIGIINRQRWTRQPRWTEMSPAQKRIKLIIMSILLVLLVAAAALYFVATKNLL